jgi:hypothetical protein
VCVLFYGPELFLLRKRTFLFLSLHIFTFEDIIKEGINEGNKRRERYIPASKHIHIVEASIAGGR